MGAWQITKKDLRLLVRDRRAVVVLVAFPLAFICILGMSTGRLLGWRAENQMLKIAVVDKDGGNISTRFVGMLGKLQGLLIIAAADRSSAHEMIDSRECNVIVVIGKRFGKQIVDLGLGDVLRPNQGKLARGLHFFDIEVIGKSQSSRTASIVGHLVLTTALHVAVSEIVLTDDDAQRMVEQGGPEAADERSMAEDTQADEPKQQQNAEQPTTKKGAAGTSVVYQQLVPSYTVMFAFFLVNVMARSFISEREMGTLRRLRIAPISAPGLLAGKTIPFLILSLIQSVALFVFGRFLFGMSWGANPWLLIPIIICTSMSATALGLLVATLVRTDSQVSAYANFLVITMAGISGCFMPRDWLPPMMQKISLSTPHAWSLIAYDQILSKATPNLTVVVECCVVLVGFAVALFVAGCWRFRTID